MITNTFVHSFHSLIDPPNKKELLDAVENAKLHDNQSFSWGDECILQQERLDFTGTDILGPSLNIFFNDINASLDGQLNVNIAEIWKNTYTKGSFQEIHDHNPHQLSGVIFLDDYKPGHGRFYFHNRHDSDFSREWREICLGRSRFHVDGKRGEVLLFPSYMMHGVSPQTIESPRRTISFNILFNIQPSTVSRNTK